MRIATSIARMLLGAAFVTFGANMFLSFLPMPAHEPGSLASRFMEVAGPSHWMHLVGACQVVGGLLVLAGGTTPLGLVFLAPVLVNVLAFHVFLLGGSGMMPGVVFSGLEVFLIARYWHHFAPLVTTKARPN